jgi:hypothetical protein
MAKKQEKTNTPSLFIDSGAYSAMTQGVQIDIKAYIKFLKENQDVIDVYANLDVVKDAEASWKNQQIMEKAGLHPLPAWHVGESFEWLDMYIEKYDYIAIGGLIVNINTKNRIRILDEVFHKHICDKEGMPKVKVHGFGMTNFLTLFRYPWYSVDSTSWLMTSRNGGILVPPPTEDLEPDWLKPPWKVGMSNRSPSAKKDPYFYDNLSPKLKKYVDWYVDHLGLVYGESIYRTEKLPYKLKEQEAWASPKAGKTREVETRVVEGLQNWYIYRDKACISYFNDIEEHVPEWPWAFKVKSRENFGL